MRWYTGISKNRISNLHSCITTKSRVFRNLPYQAVSGFRSARVRAAHASFTGQRSATLGVARPSIIRAYHTMMNKKLAVTSRSSTSIFQIGDSYPSRSRMLSTTDCLSPMLPGPWPSVAYYVSSRLFKLSHKAYFSTPRLDATSFQLKYSRKPSHSDYWCP